MSEYNEKLSSFASRLKNEPSKEIIQEVKPKKVSKQIEYNETQLNIWIPKQLLKKLKRFSLENEQTIKDSVIQAISNYLETQK